MPDTQHDIQRIDFSRLLQRNGLPIGGETEERLERYVALLAEWNEKINLVSRKDIGNLRHAHLLHSLSLLFLLDLPAGIQILDIGTGGGLPGIPLAIVRPDVSVVLVDSIQKKMAAVSDIVGKLGVVNVSVRAGRAEELSKDPFLSHTFSVVVARGVAPLADLIVWARPFVSRSARDQGSLRRVRERAGSPPITLPALIAYKGGDLEGEIRDAEVKCGRPPITVLEMVFEGSAEAGLVNKKLVAVEL